MDNSKILIILQVVMILIILIVGLSGTRKGSSTVASGNYSEKKNNKEMEKLRQLKEIKLTKPLTEKSRPTVFGEIIGQENGIKALKAALCGPNPQHVIIYGPPGIGKTAAARLVLDEAKKNNSSPFKKEAKFIEIDATTVRFDERGIADPLIGSVHDPIYQGAGSLGVAGIPQPKAGAVTKAHGGILFIDEIGELHPIELNKLLKVLEDRKVFLDSSYYSSEDPNMPMYIKEVFDKGLPADFRLIGATTRSPEEIAPAIRSRCVEIFFRPLIPEEIKVIATNAVKKVGLKITDEGLDIISKYCTNGREVLNIVQLCSGVAINENRENITKNDIEWVIETGQYNPIIENKIQDKPLIGVVNGLAVYNSNIGTVMEIEASAKKVKEKGTLRVTGIVEEEEIKSSNKKMIRKSTAYCSVQNVLTVLKNMYNLNISSYDIHVNFPGGVPVDGPSAGISIATAVYSAITKIPIDNEIAMTGEISLLGNVKAVGGITAKILGAKKAGAKRVIIPRENYTDMLENIEGIEIIPMDNIKEVINEALQNNILGKTDLLSAEAKDI